MGDMTMQMGLFGQDTPATNSYQAIPIYRVSLVREGTLRTPQTQLRNSADARTLLQSYLGDTDREHFVVLLLDRKNKVIGINTISVGSLTASVVHPRESFKASIISRKGNTEAIYHNAAAVIYGHNHPSGDPAPSQEDLALTARLVECGRILSIDVLDHIIVGDGSDRYFSFADQGLL
jgi:DNA repair protein RadC